MNRRTLPALLVSLVALLVLPGCLTSPVPGIRDVVVPGRTNLVVTTNQVELVVPAAAAGGTPSTNRVETIATNVVVEPARVVSVPVTNYVANPALAPALDAVRAANSALNPTPSAPIVDWATRLLGLVATGVAAWQTRRANNQAQAAATAADGLRTAVTAIETLPPSLAPAVKEHTAAVSTMLATAGTFADQVARLTAGINASGLARPAANPQP